MTNQTPEVQPQDIETVVQQFLLWETASRDTIDFKKIYVDMTGDLIAGLMLSQIVYWHLPDADGKTKLRVERDGHLWLAKARHEWWDECRISLEQVKRATKILVNNGLIIKQLYKFKGAATTHIRINWSTFITLWQQALDSYQLPTRWGQTHHPVRVKDPNL